MRSGALRAALLGSSAALAACALVVACSSVGERGDAGVPPKLLIGDREAAIFAAAETWTLIATDPLPPAGGEVPEDNVRGYRVLGRAELSDASARRELVESLNAGIRANDDMVAACFDPRHALRAETEAGSAELLICFECLQIYVYGDEGERTDTVLTSKLPAATFDRIFGAHGLTIAPRW
ncbi:MAG: hypothetical protein AAGB93_15885 [Planctomycetota bacterium]